MKTTIQDFTTNEKLHAVEANLEKIYDLLRDTISIAEDAYNEEKNKRKKGVIDIVIFHIENAKAQIDNSVNQFKNI